MNKLVNEAVRDYLLKTSQTEREAQQTLASLRAYRERNLSVAEPAVTDESAPGNPDSETIGAAREFIRQVATRYPVRGAILFGSRARGTHAAESDVDIAVVLRGPRGKLMETSIELADIAFAVLLETNIYIQPLPIWEAEWEHPETHSNPRLVENIRREGVPL